MGDKQVVLPTGRTRFVQVMYLCVYTFMVWPIVRLGLQRGVRWVLLRRASRAYDKLYGQTLLQADRNWDAIQRVRGAHLGRTIYHADLNEFDEMGAHYRWFYSEHATRGAWLRWMALGYTPMIRSKGRDAYVSELMREHYEAFERLEYVRHNLRQFGVPEPFLHVSFRDTLAPAY